MRHTFIITGSYLWNTSPHTFIITGSYFWDTSPHTYIITGFYFWDTSPHTFIITGSYFWASSDDTTLCFSRSILFPTIVMHRGVVIIFFNSLTQFCALVNDCLSVTSNTMIAP